MHELSLAEQVLRQVQETAQIERLRSVHRVSLEIGSLALVEQEALRFYFDILSKESIAAGAKLEIKEREARGICNICGEQVKLKQIYDTCSKGHQDLDVVSGMELLITELEAN